MQISTCWKGVFVYFLLDQESMRDHTRDIQKRLRQLRDSTILRGFRSCNKYKFKWGISFNSQGCLMQIITCWKNIFVYFLMDQESMRDHKQGVQERPRELHDSIELRFSMLLSKHLVATKELGFCLM